ncbi:S53 family peptidase [Rudaeicoccus suwonensis]|uniref:Pro-kumamolisin-like protein n=1 Tax=Rudaeicoccus suwonensis TaxID=657409 RepID=A0A561E6T7_9MICO|nr:protease pro-enzyme activation domain-containing protein [Rudaeicoccus suwonensis]TWE11337.1 pro-kumamolisin-like protein [Rudaeicoccus suwonensis]
MKRRAVIAAAAVAAVAAAPAATAYAAVSPNSTVALSNSALSPSSGARLFGAASSSTSVSFALQVPLRNQALESALIAKGTVLTPAQFAAKFAPSAAQMSRVQAWAKKQGFTVTQVSRNSGQVMVSASVGHINHAFGVTMRNATLGATSGLAVEQAPRVPASLGLSGVSGLNSLTKMQTENQLKPGSLRSTIRPVAKFSKSKSAADGDSTFNCVDYWGQHLTATYAKYQKESDITCGYVPQDLTTMYGVKKAQTKAPTIGLLLWGSDPDLLATTNSYMQAAGYPLLKSFTPHVTAPNKNMADCDPYGVQPELAIDTQSSHSISPNSPIIYYGAASCYDADLQASLQAMVDAHQVSTISMSFGTTSDVPSSNPNDGLTPADKAAWDRPLAQAALTGISAFAATGDEGNNSTDNCTATATKPGTPSVGYPAADNYLSAVGGTSIGLAENGTQPVQAGWENRVYLQASPSSNQFTDVTKQVFTEQVCGNSTATYVTNGGGGGVSQSWAMPTWQKGHVNGISNTMRALPDASALANPETGFTIHYDQYTVNSAGKVTKITPTYATYGGTSLASPILAATVALAKAYNNVQLGNVAPLFYKLAGTSAITDINAFGKYGAFLQNTSGQSLVIGFDQAPDAAPMILKSGPGWDNATGVGTPSGWAFITALK